MNAEFNLKVPSETPTILYLHRSGAIAWVFREEERKPVPVDDDNVHYRSFVDRLWNCPVIWKLLFLVFVVFWSPVACVVFGVQGLWEVLKKEKEWSEYE